MQAALDAARAPTRLLVARPSPASSVFDAVAAVADAMGAAPTFARSSYPSGAARAVRAVAVGPRPGNATWRLCLGRCGL